MLTYQCIDALEVVGDSDYAGCVDDKKSTSGYIFMMAKGAVSWKNVKQILTTFSTMEAGYVACYETAFLAIWSRNFISALKVVQSISRLVEIVQ